jgi:hypothetical protein
MKNAICLTQLDWIGLDWIGLDWIGLDWIGLDWIGLDWIGLDWIGLDWIGHSLNNIHKKILFNRIYTNNIFVLLFGFYKE